MPTIVVHSRPASLRPEGCAEIRLPLLDAPLRFIPLGAVKVLSSACTNRFIEAPRMQYVNIISWVGVLTQSGSSALSDE